MAKISTDLNVNIGINDVPASRGIETKLPPEPKGKDLLQSLSEALGTLNPKIYEIAKQAADKENEEQAVLGANTINGMTKEEAARAHQNGFPDIYNGWARVGAYKQYAYNANEEFSRTWKTNYFNNRGNPNYNWEQDYARAAQQYLSDKQNDPFFQEAFRKESTKTRDFIREKEFEFQNAELQNRIQTDTAYSISKLPEKVIEFLDTQFRSTIPVNESGKDFASKKEEYVRQNFEQEFIKQFYELKQNRNPAITNLDFDKLLIKQANFHATTDGDYSGVFSKLLLEPRPDGTPPIVLNPKLAEAATQALTNISKSLQIVKFNQDWFNSNLSSYDNAQLKKLSNDLFDRTLSKNKQKFGDNIQAFDTTYQTLAPMFAKNPPIPDLQDLLNRPLSSTYNLDTQKAFALALRLDEQGALLKYFDTNGNSKDAMKWFMAVQEFRTGNKSREDIIRNLYKIEQNKNVISLDDTDRTDLAKAFKDISLKNIYNRDLIFNVGLYFKSLDSEGDKYIDRTKEYINKYYFKESNGSYVSKAKMMAIGVEPANYNILKNEIINSIKGIEYKSPQQIEEETKFNSDFSEFTTPKEYKDKLSGFKYDFDDYEFFIDPDKSIAYFTEKNGADYNTPVVIEKIVGYRQNGEPIKETKRLEIDLKTFMEKYRNVEKLKITDESRRQFELAQKRQKAIKEIEQFRSLTSPAGLLNKVLFNQ